jgi:hypothetical protein
MKSPFLRLEDCLIERNHVFNVDRNVLARRRVQAMFVNQVSHTLTANVKSNPHMDDILEKSVGTHCNDSLTHVLGDPGVVDPKYFQSISSELAFL